MTFSQARAVLHDLTVRQVQPGLSRTKRLLQDLNRPDLAFPCVQITGTNGKGSVAAALSAILLQAGLKVGRYTSPHLQDERERIFLNREMISKAVFTQAVHALLPGLKKLRQAGDSATSFEAWTALAAHVFREQAVDIAVMEVGMGGRWDATTSFNNIILTILTNVELEHTQYLGNTRQAICREKLGITRPGVFLLCSESDSRLRHFIQQHARAHHYPIAFAGMEKKDTIRLAKANYTRHGMQMELLIKRAGRRKVRTNLFGQHQTRNMSLAVLASLKLQELGMPITWQAITRGLRQVEWPGRLEQVASKPRVVVDGAHNPAAMQALACELKRWQQKTPIYMVMGMMKDKDQRAAVAALAGAVEKVWTITPPDERGLPASQLAEVLKKTGIPAEPMKSYRAALQAAMVAAGHRGTVVIAGSLYNIEPTRKALQHLQPRGLFSPRLQATKSGRRPE